MASPASPERDIFRILTFSEICVCTIPLPCILESLLFGSLMLESSIFGYLILGSLLFGYVIGESLIFESLLEQVTGNSAGWAGWSR